MAGHVSAEGTVTTTQLARLLLLSERRIQQLVRGGILTHAFDEDTGRELRGRFRFVPNLHAYLRYQRNELGGDDVTETRYLDGRSRRMTALAEAEEMRLAQLKGKIVPRRGYRVRHHAAIHRREGEAVGDPIAHCSASDRQDGFY